MVEGRVGAAVRLGREKQSYTRKYRLAGYESEVLGDRK